MGGYRVQFKIIEHTKYENWRGNSEAIRRDATVIGPAQKRTFVIDLSKWEFCKGKVHADLRDYAIFVYTPLMLVVEKIRAICQQMPEYQLKIDKSARARDFYDIYVLMTAAQIDLSKGDALELTRQIFAAKEVPLELIGKLSNHREFHRPDWPSVEDSVTDNLQSFDFYFDFVLHATRSLESLWKV